jgi:hypothetical protein
LENNKFSYIAPQDKTNLFNGEVKVSFSWGGGSRSLFSTLIFPEKWKELKSWLVGYAIRIAGTPLPFKMPTRY